MAYDTISDYAVGGYHVIHQQGREQWNMAYYVGAPAGDPPVFPIMSVFLEPQTRSLPKFEDYGKTREEAMEKAYELAKRLADSDARDLTERKRNLSAIS